MNVMLVQHKYHKYYTFIIYTRKRNEKAREIGKIAVDFLKFIKINLFIFLFYFALISPFAMVSRHFILMEFFFKIYANILKTSTLSIRFLITEFFMVYFSIHLFNDLDVKTSYSNHFNYYYLFLLKLL